MEIVSKKFEGPIWGDDKKTHALVTIRTEFEDGQVLVQTAGVNNADTEDWNALIEQNTEAEIEINTQKALAQGKEGMIEAAKGQKEQVAQNKERSAVERLFDAKLAIFEIADIKSSKNRAIKSKIRKASTEIEATAYATALLLEIMNETAKTKTK
jgi:hypothetical protein|tara:strand:- start:1717 stop:2181 length:465 start_codon:yes stop_codon:yes gene_type:complete